MKKAFHVFLFILFAVLMSQSAWATDYYETVSTNGQIVEPHCNDNTIVTVNSGVTSFVITYKTIPVYFSYDRCGGVVYVNAPGGKTLSFSGVVKLRQYNYLYIYDRSGSSATNIYSQSTSGSYTFEPVYTSGSKASVEFSNDAEIDYSNYINLNVSVHNLYTVTVPMNKMVIWKPDGSGEYSGNSAKFAAGMKVSLGKPSYYNPLLVGLKIKDTNGTLHKVTVSGDTLQFIMPSSDVTAYPTFDNQNKGYSLFNDVKTLTLGGSESVTVYDDGGPDDPYTNNFDGWMTFSVPNGYNVKVAGTVETEPSSNGTLDYLEIFEGKKGALGDTICKVYTKSGSSTTKVTVPSNCVSSKEYLTIHFRSDASVTASGLDLTVSSVPKSYSVTVITVPNGSMEKSVSSATTGSTVILTAKPNSGYVLKSVVVKNKATNATVATSGGWETNNKVTFTMPAGNVEVTPTFVKDTYSITKSTPPGGSLDVASSAKVGSNVLITANPSSGYMLKDIVVKDSSGNIVKLVKNNFTSFSFTMPIGNVSVTPSWTTDWSVTGGLYVKMPTTSKVNSTIPTGVKSFKIYDDGGKDGSYSNSSSGTLVLTAPSGYVLQLSGTVNTYKNSSNAYDTEDYLTVCDGADTTKAKLVNKKYGSNSSIGNVYSSGQNMTLYFHSNGSGNASGLDLTVTLHKLDMDLADDGNGGKFVNMLPKNIMMLNIPSGVTSFKVYDDGGKNGNYSDNNSGTLVLKAPSGHILKFSGIVNTYKNSSNAYDTEDYLTVCDGADTTKAKLVNKKYGSNSSIGNVYSSGQSMTLYFHSNGSGNASGLDLSITVIPVENQITYVDSDSGGSVLWSSPKMANIGATVNFTYSYNSGYLVNDIKVVAESGESVKAVGGWFNNRNASFKMPHSGVTVTSTYTNDWSSAGGLYINMPATETLNATIPEGVKSFKIYDDGGKDGYYSNNSTGKLVLTAVSGYVLQLEGNISTADASDYLNVYDGSTTNSTKLLNQVRSINRKIYSSSQSMMLEFHSNGSGVSAGLNLSVTVIPETNIPSEINDIVVKNATGGKVEVSSSSAALGTTVNAVVSISSGYFLKDLKVLDEDGNFLTSVTYSYDWLSDKTVYASFTMPGKTAYVTPVFTSGTGEVFYVNMSCSGWKKVVLPEGNYSVKFNSECFNNTFAAATTKIQVTPPQGYKLHVTGYLYVPAEYEFCSADGCTYIEENDSLTLWINGLIRHYYSDYRRDYYERNDGTPVWEPSYSRSVNTYSDYVSFLLGKNNEGYSPSADLEVFVVPDDKDYTIAVSSDGGSVTSSKSWANEGDTITITATPANSNFVLNSVSVKDGSNNEVVVTGGEWYSNNKATFVMPASDVTVKPEWSSDLTAEAGLHIDMPKTGSVEAAIPEGVKSFKIYDDGGVNGAYSNNSDGSIVFTAPTGYLLKLTGTVIAERNYDKLYVYNGSAVNENNLLATIPGKATGSSVNEKADVGIIVSSGERMTVRFTSDGSQYYSGLNLTMTLVKSIASMTVANVSSQTYTGTAICPEVVVKDGGTVLVKNTDYTVTCSDNINVGTATATIAGIGGYAGVVSKQFSIIPKSVTGLVVAYEANQPYTGSVICPAVTVKDGGKTLVLNTDYTAACSGNVSLAGESANVVVSGSGNYTGQTSVPFTIVAKEVKYAAIKLLEDQNGKRAVIDGNSNDNGVIQISEDVSVYNVEFSRTFPVMKDVYSTVVLPFDVNTSQVTGPKQVLKFGGLQYVTENGVKKKAVVMNVVWDKDTSTTYADLAANTPYMVLMQDPTFDVTGAVTLKKTVLPIAREGDWELRGTLQYKKWYEGDPDLGRVYGFAAEKTSTSEIGQFVKAGAGAWIPPLRAYLIYNPQDTTQQCSVGSCRPAMPRAAIEGSLPENIDVVIGGVDGEQTTVIGRINTRTGEFKANKRMYDLKGRSMTSKPKAKGVYLKKLK